MRCQVFHYLESDTQLYRHNHLCFWSLYLPIVMYEFLSWPILSKRLIPVAFYHVWKMCPLLFGWGFQEVIFAIVSFNKFCVRSNWNHAKGFHYGLIQLFKFWSSPTIHGQCNGSENSTVCHFKWCVEVLTNFEKKTQPCHWMIMHLHGKHHLA